MCGYVFLEVKMKVLHVISDTNIGGAGVLLCTLLKHLDRERVNSIVALPKGGALLPRIEALSVPIVELSTSPDRFHAHSVQELSELIRREQVDIVHTNAAISARIAGKRCGVAVVHTRHCCFPVEKSLWSLPTRTAKAFLNRILSDRVIATAEAAAENLISLGIPRKKIELIINGSDPIRSVPIEEREAFLSRWNIPKDAFLIGMSARLVPCKGHETLLAAAKILLHRMPNRNLRFLLAGDGPHRAYLEELTERLGLSGNVHFLGFLEDVAPFYRSIHLNVNCSTGTETSCLALSEGMSAGVPMIVSDFGGNRAMVGNSRAGIVFPAGNADAFADAIARIASDPTLEKQMRTAAAHRYHTHYTAAQMADKVTQVYEQVLLKK